jgi:hypothetical protein
MLERHRRAIPFLPFLLLATAALVAAWHIARYW